MAIKRVYIEITNICNLSCSFCRKNHRRSSFMTPADFEHIVLQVKPITDFIYLHVQGEPLLHPQFEEILEIADRHEMHVQLVTNGTLLKDHPDMYRHPSLRKLSLSLQSADFHTTIPTQEYLEHILTFCSHASEVGHPFCELRFWISDKPLPEASSYCLSHLKEKFEFVPSGRSRNYRIMPGVYVDFASEFSWPDTQLPSDGNSGTCHGAVDQLAVLVSGDVIPCCLDAEGQIVFGNILETPLADILQSARYTEMADGFRRRHLTEELCRHCTYRLRFNKAPK